MSSLFFNSILFLIFLYNPRNFELRLLNQLNGALEPGEGHNFIFEIVNNDDHDALFSYYVKLPDNWQVLAAPQPVNIIAGDKDIQILSVFIPSKEPGREYLIRYGVYTNTQDSVEVDIPVTVATRRELVCEVLTAPQYVIAGDTINARFVAENKGNKRETIGFETNKKSVCLTDSIQLEASEKKVISVFKPTQSDLGQAAFDLIKLDAFIQEDRKISSSAFASVRVIPTKEAKQDAFFRYPVKVSGSYLGYLRDAGYNAGSVWDVSGSGPVDTDGKHVVEFKYSGPSKMDVSPLSTYHESFLNYRRSGFSFYIGDKSYRLTQLTEYSRMGKGVQVDFETGNHATAVFFNKPRFYAGIKSELGALYRFSQKKKWSVQTAYLTKIDRETSQAAHLYSLALNTRLLGKVATEVEVAAGSFGDRKGKAVSIEQSYNSAVFNGLFSFLQASKFFPGYFTNTSIIKLSASTTIKQKLSLGFNYNKDAFNYKRDTLWGAAPSKNDLSMELSYNYSSSGLAMFSGGIYKSRDRMGQSLFSYEDKFVRTTAIQKAGRFMLSLQGYLAMTQNLANDAKGETKMASGSLQYESKSNTTSIFTNYQNTMRYGEQSSQMIYGARSAFNFKGRTQFSLSYQSSYSIEEYYKDRSLFSWDFRKIFKDRSSISFIGKYALLQRELNKRDLIVGLKLEWNLGVPLKRLIDFGEVKGKINKADGTAEGIRLIMDGHFSITDKDGNFYFRNIVPGKKILLIDKETIGMDHTTNIKQPIELEVASGDNMLSFSVIRAAAIVGRVLFEEPKQDDTSIFDSTAGGKTLILELSNSDESIRKAVNLSGNFRFNNIRPGQWTLKVHTPDLGKAYEVDKKSFNFNLEEGDQADVYIKVIKKAKQIKFMQPEFEISID